jgi:small-conductance mechanosensitive channel
MRRCHAARVVGSRLFRAAAGAAVLLVLLGLQRRIVGLAPDAYADGVRMAVLVAAAVAGTVVIRNLVTALTNELDQQAAVIVRNLSTWTLYLLLGLWLVSSAGVDLSGLLVGGAILGVVVATASQASLGNFFAGLLLMMGRPYRVGTALRLQGGALGAVEYEGTIMDMGALYTTLSTATGDVLKLPNSAVVTSALLLGEAPLQAEIDLELPPGTPLRPVEEAVRRRLGPAAGAVAIRPVLLDAGPDGKLTCRVQVRSATPIDPSLLAEVLAQAVAEREGATPLIVP